jgi:hypothetical protein
MGSLAPALSKRAIFSTVRRLLAKTRVERFFSMIFFSSPASASHHRSAASGPFTIAASGVRTVRASER